MNLIYSTLKFFCIFNIFQLEIHAYKDSISENNMVIFQTIGLLIIHLLILENMFSGRNSKHFFPCSHRQGL